MQNYETAIFLNMYNDEFVLFFHTRIAMDLAAVLHEWQLVIEKLQGNMPV